MKATLSEEHKRNLGWRVRVKSLNATTVSTSITVPTRLRAVAGNADVARGMRRDGGGPHLVDSGWQNHEAGNYRAVQSECRP